MNYFGDLQKRKCDIQCILVNLKTQKQQQGNDNFHVLIKKVEPPTISDDIREFLSIVMDFTRLIIGRHGKDQFILRQSLQGKAREPIGELDEFDQMWTD